MLDDYEQLIQDGRVHVVEHDGNVQGVLVLIPQEDAMLLSPEELRGARSVPHSERPNMPDPSRTYALAAFCAASNTSRADVVPATCSAPPDSEVHPSCVHGLKHFFGRSGVAIRDAELLERLRPPCTRDCKGFHVEIQDFTQLLRDFIRADHRTKLDDALP